MVTHPDEFLEVPYTEPLPGQRGYRARDVDPLTRRAVDTMKGSNDLDIFHDLHSVPLTPTWNWFVRRYREEQVDAMLELYAYEIAARRGKELSSHNCPQCREILAAQT